MDARVQWSIGLTGTEYERRVLGSAMGFKLHTCRGLHERGVLRAKVRLAVRLWTEPTVTVAWIVARLAMGTPGYLNNPIRRWRKSPFK